MVEVIPFSAALGAEVRGLDLAAPLDETGRQALLGALADHLVIAVRDQDLDVAGLERFALQLGAFGPTPFLTPVQGHENVVAVIREAHETGPLFGGSWHSDWSFQAEPPSYTILYAKEVPPAGGDTLFTNEYLAYEGLSSGLRGAIAGLRGVHSARRSYAPDGTFGQADPRRSMEIRGGEAANATQCHPLVRRHPETGRPALFVNEVYTIGIDGMTAAESAAILSLLFDQARRAESTCRLRWRPGTLAIWDNRCTQHYAVDDYRGRRREMYRMTLAGEAPIPA